MHVERCRYDTGSSMNTRKCNHDLPTISSQFAFELYLPMILLPAFTMFDNALETFEISQQFQQNVLFLF